MDYKVKLTKCHNEHHNRGVFHMWAKWAQGPAGRPGFESARAKTQLDTSLRRFTRKDPRLEGGGGQEEWLADHVDGRPAIHLLQIDLAKSVGTPLFPYISPLTAKDSITHSTYSSPLVKVQFSSSSASEALSGVESRVELSFRSSSGSSLGDQ
jgi:hypothetical protein